jgi:hypothetical protein
MKNEGINVPDFSGGKLKDISDTTNLSNMTNLSLLKNPGVLQIEMTENLKVRLLLKLGKEKKQKEFQV